MKKSFSIKYLIVFIGLVPSAFAGGNAKDVDAIVDAGNSAAIRQMMIGAEPIDISLSRVLSHKVMTDGSNSGGRSPASSSSPLIDVSDGVHQGSDGNDSGGGSVR